MPWVPNDLRGKTFGMLEVLWYEDAARKWRCECVCGNHVLRSGSHLNQAAERDLVQNCGCRPKGTACKYAVMYRGELRTLTQLASMVPISRKCLERFLRLGKLCEAFIDEHLARKERIAKSKERGVTADVFYQRVHKLGWSEERALSEPVLSRGARMSGRKVA